MAALRGTKILINLALFLLPLLSEAQLRVGAERMDEYLPMLVHRNIALVINQTSQVGNTNLADTLISRGIRVKKIFAPEHGFRGDQSAGATVKDGIDLKTGLPVISLYGKKKMPSKEDLKGIDIVIFDIQDVGVRFYTYISTLHYLMQACAEYHKPLIVLDRPNPNGYYVDGPVLEKEFSSFVGVDPLPIVHGLTVGEYAMMVNGENWLEGEHHCLLTIIKAQNYTHYTKYVLPVPPSPNLSTMEAIYLYPTIGLFEGTDVSVGRGTDHPFEIIGKPGFKEGDYVFVPRSIPGKAENPPYLGDTCIGFLLTSFAKDYIFPSKEIYLYWLAGFYHNSTDKEHFFTPFFDKLAGTDKLRKQIIAGIDPEKIRLSWKAELNRYKKIRAKYLLYEDFM